ncbi:unnamed protein product [Chrysoparadoxa australica]
MVKYFNFVGVQRELEDMFDEYDEDGSGYLEYNEFAKHILGIGEPQPSPATMSVIERVKQAILDLGGANGIRTLTNILARLDQDGSKTLDRIELREGLESLGLDGLADVPGGDIDLLMEHFDIDKSGRIAVDELAKGLRGTIGSKRRKLVRIAFDALDKTGDGVVTIEDIRDSHDTSFHPDVQSGRVTADEALVSMLEQYEGPESDGTVTWREFLNYYKDLSAGIPDDSYFELCIRNAWHLSGGEGAAANSTCLRVCITRSDGKQEVVEVENDLGLKTDDLQEIKARLKRQGILGIEEINGKPV